MSYSPKNPSSEAVEMPSLMWDAFSTGSLRLSSGAAPTSLAWSAANRAMFLPFHLPAPTMARRLWYCVGATGGTNNVQLGIYRENQTLVVATASTLVGTAANWIALDITDTMLPPGSYYMAMAMNGTTATSLRVAPTAYRPMGLLMQETAFTLPTTATMVAATTGYIPYCGIMTTASP